MNKRVAGIYASSRHAMARHHLVSFHRASGVGPAGARPGGSVVAVPRETAQARGGGPAVAARSGAAEARDGGAAPAAVSAARSAPAVAGAAPAAVSVRAASGRFSPGFWIFGAILGLFFVASTIPSPLYSVYAAKFGFSSLTITLVFAVYALALLVTLLFTGSLSDAVGRRPVVLGAIAIEMISLGLLLNASSVGWLYAGRLLMGIAAGLATSTLSAALVDLQPPGRPGFAALLATIGPLGGPAIGAIGAGALVQYGPLPLQTVYAIVLGLFAALAIAVLPLPEPATRTATITLRPHIGLEPAVRASFLAALPCLAVPWALTGYYLALGPSLALHLQGTHNLLFGALDLFLLGGCAAIACYLLTGQPARQVMLAGTTTLVAGIVLTTIAVTTGITPLFLAATAVAGAGVGPAFMGALRTVTGLVSPAGRGALVAAVYLAAYVGVIVPVVVAGVIINSQGLTDTSIGYGIILAVIAAAAIPAILRTTAARHDIRC
jgi:predicted MFS family arabinose efflux permease